MSRASCAALVVTLFGSLWGVVAGATDSRPFAQAEVRFEQNATDGDVEVVFEAKAGDEGLAALRIVAPDGRTVVDFEAPDASTLGIRQFAFESPEPKDVPALKRAYPEGAYRFAAISASGQRFHGAAELSHTLPPGARILQPVGEAPVGSSLEIRWESVEGVAAWIVELEQDELGLKVNATLPGSAVGFAVPEGFLRAGYVYSFAVGSVASNGNVSFVESRFDTAEK